MCACDSQLFSKNRQSKWKSRTSQQHCGVKRHAVCAHVKQHLTEIRWWQQSRRKRDENCAERDEYGDCCRYFCSTSVEVDANKYSHERRHRVFMYLIFLLVWRIHAQCTYTHRHAYTDIALCSGKSLILHRQTNAKRIKYIDRCAANTHTAWEENGAHAEREGKKTTTEHTILSRFVEWIERWWYTMATAWAFPPWWEVASCVWKMWMESARDEHAFGTQRPLWCANCTVSTR